jgi:hypothetical protein
MKYADGKHDTSIMRSFYVIYAKPASKHEINICGPVVTLPEKYLFSHGNLFVVSV